LPKTGNSSPQNSQPERMVLLHSKKLENVPKNAVLFTEEEALKYQWDEINNHDSLSKV